MKTVYRLSPTDVALAIEQYLASQKGVRDTMKVTFEVHEGSRSSDPRENYSAGFDGAVVEVDED
jgi:hypothetical protein